MDKLSRNAAWLKSVGLAPIMLILREDNLPQAVARMKSAGWNVLTAVRSFEFIRQHGDFDLEAWLIERARSTDVSLPEDKNSPRLFPGVDVL